MTVSPLLADFPNQHCGVDATANTISNSADAIDEILYVVGDPAEVDTFTDHPFTHCAEDEPTYAATLDDGTTPLPAFITYDETA